MFSLLRRLQSLTREFANAFRRNIFRKIPSKMNEKIFFVAKFWTEINRIFREHCCCCCEFIFHLLYCPWSLLTTNLITWTACWKVSNEVQTGAKTIKFANNLVFSSNILHIYFVLLYNFLNYLQLRYLFIYNRKDVWK